MIFFSFGIYSENTGVSQFIIRGMESSFIFPMDSEETLNVQGPLGITTVQIHSGRAYIISSPCAGQTCIHAGSINRNSQWLACLPNRVFLLVEGADKGADFDALSF